MYKIQEETIIGNNKEKVENYDLMSIAIINISKDTENVDNNIVGFLSATLSNSRKAKEILDILDKKFNIKPTKNMKKEVGNMCDLSRGLFQKGVEQGVQQGVQKGIQKGIQQGKAEGEKSKTLQIAKNLMKTQNWTALQALKAAGTPKDEIPQYLALLG